MEFQKTSILKIFTTKILNFKFKFHYFLARKNAARRRSKTQRTTAFGTKIRSIRINLSHNL